MSEFRRSARLADRGLNSIFNTPPNRNDDDDITTSSEEDLPEIPFETGRQLTPLPDRNQENVSLQRLFDCVRRNPVAITQAAKLWIHNFRLQKSSALAELLSFFISGAGCPQEVLPEDVDSERLPQTIQNLIRRATELPDEDPFKAKRGRKTFKANYGLMWSEIVKESNSAALVFDSEFVSFLTTTIIEFSKSVVRSYRFVACFVCKSVSQTWVQIFKAKCETRSTTELQINNEQRKRQNKVTRKKIETLQNTLLMYQQQVQELEKLIGALFDEVLVHRFRDVCENVRSIVTEAIGQWCLTLPASFLNDQYLKYLAWPLSDKDNIVRQSAIQGLVTLYSSESNVLTLHEFSMRFKSRICEMVYDVDEGVAIGAIRLLTKLVQFNEIQINEIKHVYQILADDSVLMRNAVADLLCAILKENAKNSTDQIDQSEDRIMLCGIINIFCELANAQDPEAMEEDLSRSWTGHQILTEQSLPIQKIKDFLSPLYDRLDLLKDWDLLIDQLNESRTQSGINEGWFLMFIKILDCCVQLTHAGSKEKAFLRSRKHEIEEKQREEMTSKLMEWLVSWINEFQTDGDKVICFIRILRHLKTELFILKSLTSSFVGILQNVMEVCFKHHQSEVIEECIGTLSILGLTGPQELRTVSIDFLKMTSDRILQDLTESKNSVFQGGEIEEQYLTLSVTLERIKHLLIIEQHELLDTVNLTQTLTTLFSICSENLQLSERFGIDLSQCGFLLILWSLVPRQDPASSIGQLQNEIQSTLFTILTSSERGEIQWEANCLMVDLYLMFGHENPPLTCTRLNPEDWMFHHLWTNLEKKLNQEDLKIEEFLQDLIVVGKLVTYGNLTTEQLKWISGQFFSLITHPRSAIVELVKKVGRHVRKLNPTVLMEGYLSAMFDLYEEVKNGQRTIQDFTYLSQRLANSYLVFNNTIEQSRIHVLDLVKEGIRRATNSEELQIDFINEGLSCFNKKLPTESLQQLIQELEALQNSMPQEQYNSLKTYIQSLEGRVKRPEVGGGGQSSGDVSEEAGDGQLESKLRTPFSALPVESASTSEGEEVQIGEIEELETLQEETIITRPRRPSKTSIGARVSLSGEEGSSRKKPRI